MAKPIKTTFAVATQSGAPVEVEAHTSRKLKRLIVTRLDSLSRCTITHRKSRHALTRLLPVTMATIPDCIAFAEALEAMEHPFWEIMDGLSYGTGWDVNKLSGREKDILRDFASKARDLGIKIVTERAARRPSSPSLPAQDRTGA